MFHDEANRFLVNMEVFLTVRQPCLAEYWLVYCCHLKGWKIKNIIVSGNEFINYSSEGGLGVATGTDDIQVPAKGCPEIRVVSHSYTP